MLLFRNLYKPLPRPLHRSKCHLVVIFFLTCAQTQIHFPAAPSFALWKLHPAAIPSVIGTREGVPSTATECVPSLVNLIVHVESKKVITGAKSTQECKWVYYLTVLRKSGEWK